jgi:GAF domain-containing protein
MSENLTITKGSKAEQYRALIPQLKALLDGEPDLMANLGNIAAALEEQFGWLWVGFYMVRGDELVLGPFQGTVACTRIRKGRGVCGTAWQEKKSLIVPDVNAFPGHISCNSSSRSEIVIPVFLNGEVVCVFDADNTAYAGFDTTDQLNLGQILSLIRLS